MIHDRLRLPFLLVAANVAVFAVSCALSDAPGESAAKGTSGRDRAVATLFVYPVGEKDFVTQAKDPSDDWYNAQDFGVNRHLGEDWNKNSGGNSDCGENVRAAAAGTIAYAGDAGTGWGNVVIITHSLPNGTEVQTLYGHLEVIEKRDGAVKVGERIGTVGNADGAYLCHLHFELRDPESRFWNETGPGYSDDRKGWLDPSDFIDARLGTTPSR